MANVQIREGSVEGAAYRIAKPDNWNGRLVLFARGWAATGGGAVGPPEFVDPPMGTAGSNWLEQRGCAWAATAFNPSHFKPHNPHNFVPYQAVGDMAALHDFFIEHFGCPDYSYISGLSMGGNVSLLSLEHFPRRYHGAVVWSSAVGLTTLDYEAHTFVLGAFAAGITQEEFNAVDSIHALSEERIMSSLRTDENARKLFAQLYTTLTGGPRPFGEKSLDDSYGEAAGGEPLVMSQKAFDNTDFVYRAPPACGVDSTELNRRVLRMTADDQVRHVDPNFSFLKGAVPVPLLMVHTTGDAATPFSVMQDFRRRADAAGNGERLVQWAVQAPDHGGYELEEVVKPWEALFLWVEQDVKPEGDDVLGDLRDVGTRFTAVERPIL